MKREIEREVRLPAFDLRVGDLELLWERMTELFDSSEKIQAYISLSFPSEKLTFDSFDELIKYGQLRGRVTKFTLKLSQKGRSISLATGGLVSNTPTLKVEADSDVWCAGAVESAMRVIRQNIVWFSWLIRVPFTLIFFFLVFAPWAKIWTSSVFPDIPLPILLSWLATTVLFGYFSFNKKSCFRPPPLLLHKNLGSSVGTVLNSDSPLVSLLYC